jgi:hypothetical protein
MLADQAVPARALVDVVAEVDDQVEVVLGHVLVGGIQARLEVLARREGEPQLVGLRARAGMVRVRATGLSASPARKRYQYGRSGSRPSTSTWTEWPS